MTVTIKDIASVTGVSYSTVSKALNDSPLVKEVTKRKILEVAKEMGYEPNLAAKQLVRKKTEVVGLIWPTIERIVLATLVTNITQAFKDTRYSMILSIDPMDTAMETFRKFQVDGMIIFEDDHSKVNEEITMPFVSYGVSGKKHANHPVIDANHEASMMKAVEHLVKLGHKHIAYAGLLQTKDQLQLEKYQGYKKAMKEHSLEPFIKEVETEGLDWFDGYSAVKTLLEEQERPTAIIGGSYDISGGILRALQEQNVEVPKDISLISYDNIPQMANMEIPMTCIGVPVDVLAQEIVESVLHRIEAPEKEATVKKLAPTLVERETCGKANR
ncbi:LacI family DNA-binding transcriptional regulator [Saliterribacillus persicus]|uniref:LacI family transcriptional regulator n=1 Tax=Saliterribacillus persicus TaxID=930114 RepID=A0A368X8C9_9BACI|nr:LacI family DNA-binding transcriptional regulator [Saliterribacillus persicus]RCW64220.1 LacI family transcriptional regulator [Saliterribacillus persicus]